ncbi:MAG: ABC transporter ATP-binding protein [Tissierellia bacterium]|nr:ABC transporter ATP-binding protein [Tissierellia bacterium]
MKLYKKLLQYVPERIHLVFVSIIFAVIAAFMQIGAYWYLWCFFKELITNQNSVGSIYYAKFIVILFIAYGIMTFISITASHYLGFRLETNLRKHGAIKLMDASFGFFDKYESGRIRKIIDDNAAETHHTVAHLIPDNTLAICTPILMILLTFKIDYRLGILLIINLIIGIFQFKGMMGGGEFMQGYTEAIERMSAETIEYIRGMKILKIFGITVRHYKSLIEAIMAYSEYTIKYVFSCKNPYVWFQVLFNIFATFTIPFGLYFISKGEPKALSLAKTLFFAAFSVVAFSSYMRIMFASQHNFIANQVVDKLEALIAEMDAAKLEYGDIDKLEKFDIEFENVYFKYDEEYVLKNLSFKLAENKTYALVGPSGGGKSTIAKLISGFYSIDSGKIKIGNRNISDYTEDAISKNIAFVFQNSKLFQMSIYDNVKLGNKNANDKEIMEALKSAQCEEIINKFPQKEHTIIGSKGVHLSRGEIQRIAIARAMLKNANIIILDEASAAADPENEHELQKAFSNLMKGKTTIMIAHRLSTIRNVDEILLIEHGAIIERGSHEELMTKCGRYKELQDLFYKANEWRAQ